MNYFTDTNSPTVTSDRVIYTASDFARSSLLSLQETGTLSALKPHTSSRSNLESYLYFTVLSGSGRLTYGGETYELRAGDSVFLDCTLPYAHTTEEELWTLVWCHFDGPQMSHIYEKYKVSWWKNSLPVTKDFGIPGNSRKNENGCSFGFLCPRHGDQCALITIAGAFDGG